MLRKLGTLIGDVFFCILLAPVGIFKIARRRMKNKQSLIKGSEKVLLLSGIYIILFLILINDSKTLTNPFTYLYGSAGILGIGLGVPMLLRGMRYNKYKYAVENQKCLSVSAIAGYLKLPHGTVTVNLQRMLADGFFPNYKLDATTNTLQLNAFALAQMHTKAATCAACGAPITLFDDRLNFCEYCGARF